MKDYNLKFGLHISKHMWHVIIRTDRTACGNNLYMAKTDFLHQVSDSILSSCQNIDYEVKPLNFKQLCKKCKKKFQLTEEDINHYIVLAKLGIKI